MIIEIDWVYLLILFILDWGGEIRLAIWDGLAFFGVKVSLRYYWGVRALMDLNLCCLSFSPFILLFLF